MTTNAAYWEQIKAKAEELKSDGCSHVTQAFQQCCHEHDCHYRLGTRCDGTPITRREADARFRQCMQMRSRFGKASPMAWWRWAGVRLFGRGKFS